MATLRDLRRLVGFKTGDMFVLKATADSANASSFLDEIRTANREERAASIVNRLLYFSGGQEANFGHQAAVRDFRDRVITFSPAAPVAPVIADEVELWSVAERVGSFETVTALINYSIDAVKNIAGPEVYAAAQEFSLRVGTLAIPPGWAEFGGAEWEGRHGMRKPITATAIKVQQGLNQVRLRGAGGEIAHHRPVYLYGYERCLPLVGETDETPVNTEWIVESVAEAITLARSWASGDAAAAERRANFWSAKASAYRRSVYAGRRGLGIAL